MTTVRVLINWIIVAALVVVFATILLLLFTGVGSGAGGASVS